MVSNRQSERCDPIWSNLITAVRLPEELDQLRWCRGLDVLWSSFETTAETETEATLLREDMWVMHTWKMSKFESSVLRHKQMGPKEDSDEKLKHMKGLTLWT